MAEEPSSVSGKAELDGKQKSNKFKVNIEALEIDKPNLNNRVYPKKVVQEALDNFKEKTIFIVNRVNEINFDIVLMKDVVGLIEKEDLSLTKRYLKIKGIHPIGEAGKALENLVEQKLIHIAPLGVGEIDEKGKISNYKIIAFQVAPKE